MPNYDLNFYNVPTMQDCIHDKAIQSFDNQLKETFTKALKANGYKVTESEFEEFVKTRCNIVDYQDQKVKVFFIDSSKERPYSGTPVLEWYYDTVSATMDFTKRNELSFNFGSYRIIENNK